MPNFQIICTKPKYARGDFRFSRFEELYWWLIQIKGLAKGTPGRWLYALAKSGRSGLSSGRADIQIESDWHDYFLARDAAKKTAMLKTGWDDVYNASNDAALSFARHLDGTLDSNNI